MTQYLYPFLGLFALIAICLLSLFLVKNKTTKTITLLVSAVLCFAYFIVMLIIVPAKSEKYAPLSMIGMYAFSFLLIAILIALPVFIETDTKNYTTKSLAFGGLNIALSFALSYIKLFSLPQGGSITLASMLPLIIYAYAFGAKKGITIGVIYGILQFIQSPQIYEPMQVILDYPVAFAGIGLAGILKHTTIKPVPKFILSASIGCVFRYLAHFLSGYYVFSSWKMEGYSALTWSLAYNLYILVELAIILFIGCFIFSSKSFVKELEKINN